MRKLGEEVPAPAWSGAQVQSGGLSGAKEPTHLVLWVLNLHEHAKPGGGRLVFLSLLVIQLRPVVSWKQAGRAQSEEREVALSPLSPGHADAACSQL